MVKREINREFKVYLRFGSEFAKQITSNALSISRSYYEFTNFSANSVLINLLFRELTMDSPSISRIHYDFTVNSLGVSRIYFEFAIFFMNSLWFYYELTWCFANILWIHYLFREVTMNLLSQVNKMNSQCDHGKDNDFEAQLWIELIIAILKVN